MNATGMESQQWLMPALYRKDPAFRGAGGTPLGTAERYMRLSPSFSDPSQRFAGVTISAMRIGESEAPTTKDVLLTMPITSSRYVA